MFFGPEMFEGTGFSFCFTIFSGRGFGLMRAQKKLNPRPSTLEPLRGKPLKLSGGAEPAGLALGRREFNDSWVILKLGP